MAREAGIARKRTAPRAPLPRPGAWQTDQPRSSLTRKLDKLLQSANTAIRDADIPGFYEDAARGVAGELRNNVGRIASLLGQRPYEVEKNRRLGIANTRARTKPDSLLSPVAPFWREQFSNYRDAMSEAPEFNGGQYPGYTGPESPYEEAPGFFADFDLNDSLKSVSPFWRDKLIGLGQGISGVYDEIPTTAAVRRGLQPIAEAVYPAPEPPPTARAVASNAPPPPSNQQQMREVLQRSAPEKKQTQMTSEQSTDLIMGLLSDEERRTLTGSQKRALILERLGL